MRQLLAETGYERLTVDAVAARAGIGKAAIYRRYASKVELAFAASVHDDDLPPPADTGSLHDDLLAIARRVHARMNAPAARQIGPAVIAELARSAELTEKFQQGPLAAERELYAKVLDRAAARGEIARPIDPAVVHLLVSGPIFFAVFGYRVPVDDAVLETIVTTVTAGLRP
ncbi:TetR/AcrR family transcriptional regulator [Nonomuraea indica]|uniref:TetR/AcrR family transcriptional regulator n=1 Tax=Nonomuraea indica TaxID=1581193 RepID=UPI001C5DBB5A|nr:TetR/AcrR family transcriptional regulator [Nonomuraea indica]